MRKFGDSRRESKLSSVISGLSRFARKRTRITRTGVFALLGAPLLKAVAASWEKEANYQT